MRVGNAKSFFDFRIQYFLFDTGFVFLQWASEVKRLLKGLLLWLLCLILMGLCFSKRLCSTIHHKALHLLTPETGERFLINEQDTL